MEDEKGLLQQKNEELSLELASLQEKGTEGTEELHSRMKELEEQLNAAIMEADLKEKEFLEKGKTLSMFFLPCNNFTLSFQNKIDLALEDEAKGDTELQIEMERVQEENLKYKQEREENAGLIAKLQQDNELQEKALKEKEAQLALAQEENTKRLEEFKLSEGVSKRLQDENARQAEELQRTAEQAKQLEEAASELKEELQERDKQLDSLREQNAKLIEELRNKDAQLAELQERNARHVEEVNKKNTQIELLAEEGKAAREELEVLAWKVAKLNAVAATTRRSRSNSAEEEEQVRRSILSRLPAEMRNLKGDLVVQASPDKTDSLELSQFSRHSFRVWKEQEEPNIMKRISADREKYITIEKEKEKEREEREASENNKVIGKGKEKEKKKEKGKEGRRGMQKDGSKEGGEERKSWEEKEEQLRGSSEDEDSSGSSKKGGWFGWDKRRLIQTTSSTSKKKGQSNKGGIKAILNPHKIVEKKGGAARTSPIEHDLTVVLNEELVRRVFLHSSLHSYHSSKADILVLIFFFLCVCFPHSCCIYFLSFQQGNYYG